MLNCLLFLLIRSNERCWRMKPLEDRQLHTHLKNIIFFINPFLENPSAFRLIIPIPFFHSFHRSQSSEDSYLAPTSSNIILMEITLFFRLMVILLIWKRAEIIHWRMKILTQSCTWGTIETAYYDASLSVNYSYHISFVSNLYRLLVFFFFTFSQAAQ